eukprot:1407825-Prymnesium_polylepis.1
MTRGMWTESEEGERRRGYRSCGTAERRKPGWMGPGRDEVGLHVIGRHTQPVEDMAVVTNALR